MRLVTFWLIILGLLMVAKHSLADSISIRGGPSLQDGKPNGEAKYFGVRYEAPLGIGYVATEGGGWVDNGEGRKSSLVGKLQLGVAPGQRVGIYAKGFLGPCAISATDGLLGGLFQICSDIGVGFRDTSSFIDFGYSHISSAGLSKPNKGRDLVIFSAGVLF